MAVKEKKPVQAATEPAKRRGRPPKSAAIAEKKSVGRPAKAAGEVSTAAKVAVKAKPGRKPGKAVSKSTTQLAGQQVKRGPGRPPLNRPVQPKVLDRFSVPKLIAIGKLDVDAIKLLYTPSVFSKLEKWCGLAAQVTRSALGVKDGSKASLTAEQTKKLGSLVAAIEQLRKKFGIYGAKLWLNEKADEFAGKTASQVIKSANGIAQFIEVVAKLKPRPPVPGPRRGRKPGTKVAVTAKGKRGRPAKDASAKKKTAVAAKPASVKAVKAKVAKKSPAKSAVKATTAAKRGRPAKVATAVKTDEVKRRGRPAKASAVKVAPAKAVTKPAAKKAVKSKAVVAKSVAKKPGRKPKAAV